MGPTTARPALAARGPRLRSRRRLRFPGDRPHRDRAGRTRGGPGGRRPPRDAHELTDPLLVRAWGSPRWRSDRPGVLLVSSGQLTWAIGSLVIPSVVHRK